MHSDGFWVFGYGSLVWQPGFDYSDRQIGRLHGYARSFCMHSIHHRGTQEKPGLVLALDKEEGAYCDGVAFRVPAQTARDTLAALRERELISSAYLEVSCPVDLRTGQQIEALCYVIDPHHVQYTGGIGLEQQARIIAHAVGGKGPNTEYLYNTSQHLADLGLEDDDLIWLSERVRALAAGKLGVSGGAVDLVSSVSPVAKQDASGGSIGAKKKPEGVGET
jgi:glutathione-specific gamma-glutamylcyclotransferase